MRIRSAPVLTFVMALAASPLLAADLVSLVPLDATTVAMVHISDLRTSPLSGSLFSGADRITADGEMTRFLDETGLSPTDDVDSVLVALSPETNGIGARALVAAEGRFDPQKLSAAVVTRGGVLKNSSGGAYLLLPESGDGREGAVAFVDAHLVIGGDEASVMKALSDRQGAGTGFAARAGLGREMARIPAGATSWLVVDVPRSERFGARPAVRQSRTTSMALDGALQRVAVVAVWATDRKDALELGGSAVSYDSETRQLLGDTVRGLLATWRLAAQGIAPELVDALRLFNVRETADAVTVVGTLPAALVKSWGTRMKAGGASMHCASKR